MTVEQIAELATFGAVWAVLAVGHNLADHVLGQTDYQAIAKVAPTPAQVAAGISPRHGWRAYLAHVGLYHLVLATLFVAVWAALPLHVTWLGVTAGFALSAATHAVIDRRWPVRWVLRATGSSDFADMNTAGLNGMYLADQALHAVALLVSALLITLL